ncbi:SHOCT domain-containing protein [Desulfosporosinus sp.]|uniref:SHOCT domain-containing protein n=1 Tax=Desulfosporosinus sp. TaxID=157907 RepID=UPI0025BA850D|nr:SHOCT domain-containing protein [Desulfosporosinus sp.]MBC2726141.1 SHOCT domain-containing protein [Desulfosporosinus sp.]
MMFGLILLIFIAYYMLATSNSRGSRYLDPKYQRKNTPLDIVNERYARGEIQKEEYLERKQELLS